MCTCETVNMLYGKYWYFLIWKLFIGIAASTETFCYCEPCEPGISNNTCVLDPGGQCFASISLQEEENELVALSAHGCLGGDAAATFQCNAHKIKNLLSNLKCCNTSMCNRNISLETPMPPRSPIRKSPISVWLIVACVLVFIAICIIVKLIHCYHYSKKQKFLKPVYGSEVSYDGHTATLQELIEQSSGSGSGVPMLIQSTIAKQIQMVSSIGIGRYGEVWHGKWREENVAVKVFKSTEEASWKRETDIYQTVLLRHENILGFIAADIMGTGSWTQLYLITDYHKNGSLYDYLQEHTVSPEQVMRLSYCITAGLCHLHTEIHGTQGKPAIAHRDIKSKNILVKDNGSCCIADLGLAVKYQSLQNKVDIAPNTRQGTKRYMAPEVLDETLNPNNFDDYKISDMYSLALVFWEIITRCDYEGMALEYCVPYHDLVDSDPTFEEMRKVVCVSQQRPVLPFSTVMHSTLGNYRKLIEECWAQNPTSRLTSLRVQKNLIRLRAEFDLKE